MEVLLGYVLGLGTVIALAKRGSSAQGGESGARKAVAWTARQVGAISGRVATSLGETARAARAEYERGREEQVAQRDAEARGETGETIVHRSASAHLNGN